MQRQIKFRGIPLFGKNFVHGSLVVDINEKGEETFIIRRNKNSKVSNFEVIPATVNQYTGLADKNGVEIYENDLLRYNDNYFKIEYDNGAFWGIPYKCTRSDIKMAKHPLGQILHYVFDDTICEVIGNIYENSELLKDEE